MTEKTWKYAAKGICSGMDTVQSIRFARVAAVNGVTYQEVAVHVPGDGNGDQPRDFWTQERIDTVAASIVGWMDGNLDAQIAAASGT